MLRLAAFTATAGPVSAYAPPFMTIRTALPSMAPSAATPVFTVIDALSLRQVSIDSEIDRHSLTGRFAFHEIAAASGSILTDALPPKPPPTNGVMMRTEDNGRRNMRESTFCTAVGDWPQLQTVKDPSS